MGSYIKYVIMFIGVIVVLFVYGVEARALSKLYYEVGKTHKAHIDYLIKDHGRWHKMHNGWHVMDNHWHRTHDCYVKF